MSCQQHPSSNPERVLANAHVPGMDLFQLESSWLWLVTAFALLELAALMAVFYLGRLRRRRGPGSAGLNPVVVPLYRDPKWVSCEIERMCSGRDANEPLIKQMSAAERALFEVSVIDALNNRTREDQHRLRSALIKYGYDENCARRVMCADLSDRVRACALLGLLRPQWREEPTEPEHCSSLEDVPRALAASRTSGSLEVE